MDLPNSEDISTDTEAFLAVPEEMRNASPRDIRRMIRKDRFAGNTSGFSLGYLQGNLAILPAEYAMDFLRYCQRDPKPCPLVGVSDTGDPTLPSLGSDIDIRTDIPSYNVYRDGENEAIAERRIAARPTPSRTPEGGTVSDAAFEIGNDLLRQSGVGGVKPEILRLQTALNGLGRNIIPLKRDGVFGPRTNGRLRTALATNGAGAVLGAFA